MKSIIHIFLIGMLVASHVNAQINIKIKPETISGIPVAIVPFAGSEKLPQQLHDIVANDLRLSGKFDPIAKERFLAFPSREEEVQYKDWRLLGAELLAIGNVAQQGENYIVTFLLYSVSGKRRIGGYRYSVDQNGLREVAHKISDYIYEKRIGKKGVYTSKIAFVKREGKNSALQVADWDGYGAQTVVSSKEPIMSPDWSADGSQIAFVTFDKGRSMIKTVTLATGEIETLVKSGKGLNSAPAWSPDGRSLAFASSRTGNSEIFIMDMASKKLRKLTNHWNIDTEPAWSQDGQSILFTSGRSGRANVYEINVYGGAPVRLTFSGDENGDAKVSPDGQNLTVVMDGGTTIMTRRGQLIRTLYDSGYDESPSFSGNGDMVLFGIKQGYNGKLMVSSVDGRAQQALDLLSGDVRDSAWSSN